MENVTKDDLILSAGTVVSVTGSGSGPYAFAVADLPPGTTTATIGGDIAADDGLALSTQQWTFDMLWPGDVNGDGYVNVGDLQGLVAAWDTQETPPSYGWDPRADINGDRGINVGDLQVLAANWGQSLH